MIVFVVIYDELNNKGIYNGCLHGVFFTRKAAEQYITEVKAAVPRRGDWRIIEEVVRG